MKWIIFLAMVTFLPCIFYLAATGAIIPLIYIFIFTVQELFNPIFENYGLFIMGAIHIFIYSAIFYVVSIIIAKLLYYLSKSKQKIFVGAIVIAIALIGLFPIYGGLHHSSGEFKSLYALLLQM